MFSGGKMKISVCSVATTKSLKEFELLKFSFEQYHEAEWFVATHFKFPTGDGQETARNIKTLLKKRI